MLLVVLQMDPGVGQRQQVEQRHLLLQALVSLIMVFHVQAQEDLDLLV